MGREGVALERGFQGLDSGMVGLLPIRQTLSVRRSPAQGNAGTGGCIAYRSYDTRPVVINSTLMRLSYRIIMSGLDMRCVLLSAVVCYGLAVYCCWPLCMFLVPGGSSRRRGKGGGDGCVFC